MIDIVSISALVISVITALGTLIKDSHLKHCNICGICDSDCRDEGTKLNKKIERKEKIIDKTQNKLELLKQKKKLSNSLDSPSDSPISETSIISETSFKSITEI